MKSPIVKTLGLKRAFLAVACGAMCIGGIGCEAFKNDRPEPREPRIIVETPTIRQQERTVRTQERQARTGERIAQAHQLKDSGDYDTALAMFQEILSDNPMLATAYIGVGDIYILKHDYDRAEPAYARAARLEPRNFDAQYGHGLALQMLQRFVEAVRAYHRALTINPNSFDTNLNLATTYLQMNEPSSAVTFAETAVRLNPGNGSARVNLGAAYEKVGRHAEAIDQYLAAMELVENTPPLMLNLITVLAAEKRYQEAANVAENLVRIDPSANAYERLGWCYFRLSDFDRSLHAYEQAVNMDPNHWVAFNGVGVNLLNKWLLSKQQDNDLRRAARDAFRRSLRINPQQPKLISLMSNYQLDK